LEINIVTGQILQRRSRRFGTYEFASAWEKEQYEKHKIEYDMLPKYTDGSLTYTFNNLGYRTPAINTFKDNEFILVFGCSYTEGVGLHEEDLWHSHLSLERGLPIMNLAIGGTGGDIIRLNSVLYNKNSLPKPKFVVFQWPGDHRRMFASDSAHHIDPNSPSVGKEGEHDDSDNEYSIPKYREADIEWYRNRYVPYVHEAQQAVFQNYITANTVFNLRGVPTYNWQYAADRTENKDNVLLQGQQLDLVSIQGSARPMARDMMHPGAAGQLSTYSQIQHAIRKIV